MNIPSELEGPTTLSAENFSLPVYSISNFVESLNSTYTKDISYNTGTPTGFRSTASSNEDDSTDNRFE